MRASFCFMRFIFLIGLLCPFQWVQSQTQPNSYNLKNGISRPNTLATHPFGILFYTLPQNFKESPDPSATIGLQFNSGNVWGQPVTTFLPSDENIRQQLENIPFFSRIFEFDESNLPSESYSFQYDGVIKDIRLVLGFPVGKQNEVTLTARSFLLTDGTFPFSFVTSDRFIEFFHRNIAGGDDPFGRERLGLDQAGIRYVDRNGREFDIAKNEFVFSGIEGAYYLYSNPNNANLFFNLGFHIGANLSRLNSSLDLGLSFNGLKKYRLTSNSDFRIGTGIGILRRDLVNFNTNQTDLGTSNYFGNLEAHLEYSKKSRGGTFHSFGINYRIQTPYNNKAEEDYYVPFSPTRIARWHEASRHLYRFPSYWSFIYTITKKVEFSIYLQQDLLVNNTPDIQTGLQLRIPVFL